MSDDTFFNKLQALKANRKDRLQMADRVLQNPLLFPELLQICYLFEDPVSSRACWVLELVIANKPQWLIPCLDEFTLKIKGFILDSSIRPVSKICYQLVKEYFKKGSRFKNEVDEEHLNRITATAFDWLINDEKIAAKGFAIYTLFELGKKYNWIYPELKYILEKNMPSESAGYRAAAKKILSRIAKDS